MNLINKFRLQTYNVGIVTKQLGDMLSSGIGAGEIRWLRHNYTDRFFADPFLLDERDGVLYVLVEEYPFWTEKGRITLLEIDKARFELRRRMVVIEELAHLSFPFCELGGTTVVPESNQLGVMLEYQIDPQTLKPTSSRQILSTGLIDAVFYTDANGDEWVLGSKSERPKEDLYLYKRSGGNLIPCSGGRPVVNSLEHSRCAGRLFNFEGRLYRPAQDCVGRYGKQTKIMEVLELSEAGLVEKEVVTLSSNENPPYHETMHTFNVYDSFAIVDGSKDFVRFPSKVLYKLCSRWRKRGSRS